MQTAAESPGAPALRPWLPAPAAPPVAEAAAPPHPAADRRNLLLIGLGFLALLVLIPPGRDYPIIDDWIYAGAVQHQLATGVFVMPDQSQANLAGLALWGTLWTRVFGFSYTVLTAATLALALAGLLAFYGLARRVGVPPAGALLGTALLGLNPLWLHLSYSFMTDVPFLALLLIACYCYVRGLQGPEGTARLGWLLAGGLVAGWGFTVRQFAVIAPIAFVLYLLLDGLLSRRWRWRALLLIAAGPVVAEAAWWVWTHNWPETSFTAAADALRSYFIFQEPWPRVFGLRALASLPLTALSAWTAVTMRRSRWWLVALWAVIVAWAWVAVNGSQEQWIGTTEPPFVFQFGPLSFPLPQELDTFVGVGNVLRVGGFDFFQYRQAAIWTPEVWALIFVLTSVLGILLLAKMTDALLDFGLWVVERGLNRNRARNSAIRNPQSALLSPLVGVYLTGLGIAVATLALGGDYFDRYVLGWLPFAILFVVRGTASTDARLRWGRRAWTYAVGACVVLGAFSLLLQRDFVAHDNARWQAGDWLLARGVGPVHGGYDWDYVRGVGNGLYEVTDQPIPSFRTELTVPYQSWLTLSQPVVLAQSRADLPPLPTPTPAP